MTVPQPENDDSPKEDLFFDAEGEEEPGVDQQAIMNNVRDIVDMLGGLGNKVETKIT